MFRTALSSIDASLRRVIDLFWSLLESLSKESRYIYLYILNGLFFCQSTDTALALFVQKCVTPQFSRLPGVSKSIASALFQPKFIPVKNSTEWLSESEQRLKHNGSTDSIEWMKNEKKKSKVIWICRVDGEHGAGLMVNLDVSLLKLVAICPALRRPWFHLTLQIETRKSTSFGLMTIFFFQQRKNKKKNRP